MLLHHNIDNLALDNDNLLGLLICQPLLRPLRGYDMLNDVVLREVEGILLLEAQLAVNHHGVLKQVLHQVPLLAYGVGGVAYRRRITQRVPQLLGEVRSKGCYKCHKRLQYLAFEQSPSSFLRQLKRRFGTIQYTRYCPNTAPVV